MNNQEEPVHIESSTEVLVLEEDKVLNCSNGELAQNVCFNSNCTQYVFLCDKKTCQCYKKHRGCIKGSMDSITQALQQKLNSIEPFEKKIDSLIQKAIDDLSQFANQILDKARQSLNYVGLTQNERKYMKAIKKGHNHGLTGKQMHDINLSINHNEQFITTMTSIQERINNTWFSFSNEMNQSFQKIKGLLGIFSKNTDFLFKDSKVIQVSQYKTNLLNFFNKKPIFATLLYRASQNQFQVQKFFDNCKDITNTVVICQTYYGKIIGGFTPVPWKQYYTQNYIKDESGQSFVFTLSNNDKFSLQSKSYALRYYPGYGPMFGNSSGMDFFITNKANVNRGSGANICNGYYNNKYIANNNESWLKFSGCNSDFSYIAKEWEVWQVQFQN